MATARDVAKRAGVSTSTVSHVINGTRLVSDDLRQRVAASMHDLGYEPNAVARMLKVKRSNTIGLLIPNIGNPFFTDVLRGVEDVANRNGFLVVQGNTDEDLAKEDAYLRVMSSRQVDGLILAPAGQRPDYDHRLGRLKCPIVFLDREIPDLAVSSVLLDNETAACEAVRYLIQLGHRRIALVAGRPHISSTEERISGYRRAMKEAGISVTEDLIVFGGSRTEEARVVTLALLDRDPRPTAFFVGNNLMTIGALTAIEERGLSVPDDIALAGFDDFSWAEVFRPKLTTVAQPTYELGRTAADLLLQQISGEVDIPRRVVLPGRLVIRESSGNGPTH